MALGLALRRRKATNQSADESLILLIHAGMEPNIILKRRSWRLNSRELGNFVEQASRTAGLRGSVSLMITNSREMQELNSRFRGKTQPTDVLSFPAPVSNNGFAGDIAISYDIAGRNAKELGHSVMQELKVLVLHGILHLAGYDHESDAGEMARYEQRLRSRLALPLGLIERNSRRRKHRPRSIAT